MEIGGFFPYKKGNRHENGYLEGLCPEAGDIRHLMSGRCAIYYCIQDSFLTDQKRVAYLPSYTCETVTGCFVKAGYEILYYDINEKLEPIFDENVIDKISMFLITGYYGYSTFDKDFIARCRKQGVTVMQDITHTAFSADGVCEETDYIVNSLRKWMGVISGGIAIKRHGTFGVKPLPKDEVHLAIRDEALSLREQYEVTGDEALNQKSADAFWKAEFMLREMFDMQEGDEASYQAICHYPVAESVEKRRENYRYLMEHFPTIPGVQPIFTVLPDEVCPMFFPMLVDDRDAFMEYLKEKQVVPKIYWPVPPFLAVENYPHAQNVFSRIMSVSCDQRFSINDMKRVIDVFASWK